MTNTTITELHKALGLEFSLVTRVWDYKAKDWVTGVFAEDIDDDGEVEVIASSRDGRLHLLSAKGDYKWERVVGHKTWVGTLAVSNPSTMNLSPGEKEAPARIIVGTRDGKVYVFDKDGRTISKEGTTFAFDSDGLALDPEHEQEASWYDTGYVIRQVYVDPVQPTSIIFGSEDRCVYVLDYLTGQLRWKYQTNGWVRAIFSYDLDEDGIAEILVGSGDKHVYLLDQQGQVLAQHNMGHAIQRIVAADVDDDGQIEILVGTDGKDLAALTYHHDEHMPGGYFQEKWRYRFDNRILSLCITDVDNDRKKEIIAGSEDKHIYILDAHGKIIWQHNHKYRIFSIYPCDIDNDGVPELLVGSEHNRVRAMRIRAHAPRGLEGKIRRYYRRLLENEPEALLDLHSNERALLEDVVRERVKEHVTLKQAQEYIKKGEPAQALSTLIKLQQNKVEQILQKGSIGHIRTVCFRHITSDPRQEIIVVNTNGDVQAFNSSGRYLWSEQLNDHIIDVQTGFIDHHKQEEIVACSSDHHVYILSGARKRTQRNILVDTWMSSICVTSTGNKDQAEIIIGSEDKKLYIYESNLDTPVGTIGTPEGIRLVRAHTAHRANEPEIIAASLGNSIYAYSRNKTRLWEYETKDHIRAIRIKDIDGDGKAEVLIGSEDRNIHVVDSTGHLLWRFYLPHSALSIDAEDVDQDGKIEILVGCADGYLYVFNQDGDQLWKYQARDRIQSVRVADIDNDGSVEIATGSEDQLEVLRVVDQQQVQALINQCWRALCQLQPTKLQAINELLNHADPVLKAFAISKFAEQHLSAKSVDTLQQYVKDDFVEARQMLVRVVMEHYNENVVKARQVLYQLSTDADGDVKNTFIEHILTLVKNDWEFGFHHLKRFLDNPDRYVRRMVVRKLHQLVDMPLEKMGEKHREIFDLLLVAVQDHESEWIRQEAARALAHYLNSYHGGLIIYVHLFIVKGIRPAMLERVAYAATIPAVKHYIEAVIPMLSGLNDENALERTQQVVKSLEEASALLYGRDIRILYAELCRLLNFSTIDDIATYQPALKANQFPVHNEYAAVMLNIFEKLNSISRTLKMYLWRDSVPDRLSSLLETIAAIDKISKDLEKYYSVSILREPVTNLPDHYLFTLLLKKWRGAVLEQLNKLRGRAELKADLQTKFTRNEDQVGIWFNVSNAGSSSATSVQVTLLYSDQFEVVETKSFKIEAILPQEEKTLEFIIKPHALTLDLSLEVVYDDVEGVTKMVQFGDRLELKESRKPFHAIPNPYSTGTPTRDVGMFYGREADIGFLKDNLTRPAKTVIVLYGQRRSGKTTMLLQLINTFATDRHIPVLIDMQRVSYRISIHSFLYKMALYIAQAMQQKGIAICKPEAAEFGFEPTSTFDAFLDNVEAQLTGQKLILMIDEFEILEEQVLKGKLQVEVFEYLRDILQHRPSINFLFSGTHKITDYTKWYRSVFFNIARHYRLSKLNPQGAEDLIMKPVEGFLEYEPFAVKKVHQLTAYQPYLIHLLCRSIVDYCNEKRKVYVTINDVNIVSREVMLTGQFHFDWLWDQISPEDRVALSALAEGEKDDGRWLSLAELEDIYRHNGIPFSREYLRTSLKTLLEADFIESGTGNGKDSVFDSSRFRIPVGLTREWLHKEKPLEFVRKELSN